uniref:Secreted protein n=1 Tax=Timema bartmani TaxID=61472 RepID=A0A7R9F9Z3_9NEOP|nr:unnamed protein product [Timema bartmani]
MLETAVINKREMPGLWLMLLAAYLLSVIANSPELEGARQLLIFHLELELVTADDSTPSCGHHHSNKSISLPHLVLQF